MSVKQCIVIRKDLKMRRGKEITQGSHASSAFMTKKGTTFTFTKKQIEWLNSGQTKITLVVDSEKELLDIFNKAKAKGLEVHLITDAGRTEFGGVPTKTALAIGPDDSSKIDEITGSLKLY